MRRSILTRLGIGLLVIVAIALLNPGFLGWGAAVTATIIAVPSARFRSYTAAFLPYGLAWLSFTLLRALADETGIPLRTDEVTAIERWMFFGATPTIWLQTRMFDPSGIAWYDYVMTFIHWSYFFVPHVAAVVIWKNSPALYRRFLLTVMITLGIGLIIYFITPAAPPWLTADRAPQQDIFRVMANVGRSINSSLYDRTYSALGDPNPVAAMPSLHLAVTFIVFLFARHAGRAWGIAGLVYAIAMGFSLVYTGEHYVIDGIVGCAIALYAYMFAGNWLSVTAPVFRQLSFRAARVGEERAA
ncbi:MAG TPA: phosphatase PAP2 family protein [Thermomicrobiales bacterium]|nr:phosphatase PAP2 family protein [Thermomicrobiales bacterium]